MNVKTLTQVFLILTTISITLFFFFKYFYQKNNTLELVDKEIVEEKILVDEKIDNIINDLTFENIDTDGNKFKIESKYGELSLDDDNSVKLIDVKATINIVGKDTIFIKSEKAIYNKLSLKTKFYINVNIIYQENLIISDNFNIDLSKNVASINGNVIFNNKNIESYADNIDFNLIDENITINMFDKEDNIKIKRK
tara:strand:- start:423 stop:1010 length:588 start_codon:yes stop_codon:yes gene_type:complete